MVRLNDPVSWLRDHLQTRLVDTDRIEVIATVRPHQIDSASLSALVALASDSLIKDAFENGVSAGVISTMGVGG